MEEHFVGKVAQKAIIEKEGKVLVQRHPSDTKWDLPGGRLHKGEQPTEGLMRELQEELGAGIEVGVPFFVEMTKADSTGEERYFIAFRTTLDDPTKEFIFQKEEVEEIRWIGKEEILSLPMFEVCRRAVQKYFATA